MQVQPFIVAAGTTITSSGASQSAVIPTCRDGGVARYVRVCADTAGFIKFGLTGVACTANDILVTNNPTIFNVRGVDHFAVLQATAGAKINIVPLENA